MKIIFVLTAIFFGCVFSQAQDKYLTINPNGHRSTIKAMAVDNDGKIITAGYDKTIKIWNSKEGYLEREIRGYIGPGDEGAIHTLAISPDNKYLAVAGWFGNTEGTEVVGDIRIFNYKTGALLKVLVGHRGPAFDLQFSANSDYMLSAGQDGEVFLWEISTANVWHADKIPADITDIERSENNFYTSHKSGLVYMWSDGEFTKPADVYKGLQKAGLPASELAVAPDGQKIAVSSGTDFYILNGQLKQVFSYHHGDDEISMMNFSPDNSRLIVASSSMYLIKNLVRVYEESDGKWYALSAFMKHTDAIGCAQFIDDNTCVTAGGNDNEVAVWEVEESKKYSTLTHWMCGVGKAIHSVGFHNDKIGFTTAWSKNDGLSEFKFTFDLAQRLIRNYSLTDSCSYPVQSIADYTVKRPSSLSTLTLRKGDVIKATLVRNFSDGIVHFVYTFIGEQYLVSGGSYGFIEVFDLTGKKVTRLVGHEGDIRGLSVSTDGKFLISGGADQTIRIWKVEEFAKKEMVYPVVSLFAATNGEWVLWNEQGYFTSSKRGASYVGYHINQGKNKEAKYYPFEQFDIKYNRPDIIMDSLDIVNQSIIELYHSAYLKRLKRMNLSESDLSGEMNVPSVRITNTPINKQKISLAVVASDSLFGLKALHVFLNDVPVYGRNGLLFENASLKKIQQTVDLELMAGVNKIQVSVTNTAGVESLKETVTINNSTETESNLFIVSLGVSHYKDSAYNLDYAAKDAEDVSALFSSNTYFKNVNQKVLVNENVTRQKIVDLKEFLSQANRNDVVLFFIAGHGVLNKNLDYYFCTYDMDFLAPEKFGITYAELEVLFDGIKAIRKLLIMDTCHSGEVDKDDVEEVAFVNSENSDITFRNTNTTTTIRETQGLQKTNEAVKEMFNDLRTGTGATVISSAGGAEYAMESDEWKNGLFTYCLLEGIKSKNADADKNGEIMLSELQNYISIKVAELSKGRQMPTSRFENLNLDYRVW